MNRRNFLTKLIPATVIAGMTTGATAVKRDNKCVLVCDPARVTVNQAQHIGQSLGLPETTQIVFVRCEKDQHPEDAFAVLEQNHD